MAAGAGRFGEWHTSQHDLSPELRVYSIQRLVIIFINLKKMKGMCRPLRSDRRVSKRSMLYVIQRNWVDSRGV